MPTTTLTLNFPDQSSQEDFEVAFRGWLKQYQQQAGLTRALIGGGPQQGGAGGGPQQGGAGGGPQQGSTGGLTGSGDAGSHSYGGGGQQGSTGGLISWGGGSGGGYSSGSLYLNFIGGW